MINFARYSYLVPVLKQVKKIEKKSKKVFLTFFPGLKSEFLRPKTFFKNFIYAFKAPVKKFRKKFVSIIYPGYQIQGLPVYYRRKKFSKCYYFQTDLLSFLHKNNINTQKSFYSFRQMWHKIFELSTIKS
jgi:hypothetical protein